MSLEARVRAWVFERRRAVVLEALSVACGGVAALGACALADRALTLPAAARWAAWLAAAGWAARAAASGAAAARRAGGALEAAAAAERAWPQASPLLSSAWELRESAPAPGASAALRAEHLARADRAADGLTADAVFAWRPSRAARAALLAACGGLVASALAGAASRRRALAPWDDESLDRWVSVAPGDARVDEGSAPTILASPTPAGAARGVRAADLELDLRSDGGRWEAAPWTRLDGGAAQARLAPLTAPLDYRVRWRGLAGTPRRLTPEPPPRWRSLTATVRSSRGARRFDLSSGETILAKRGDWVELVGEPNAALSCAALAAPGEPLAAMAPRGGNWSGGFLARRDGELAFALSSADGRRDPAPPVYAVRIEVQAPPTVELISPPAPLVASPDDDLPVSYAARADGKISRLALIVRVAGRAEASVPIPIPGGPSAEVLGDFTWPLSSLKSGERAAVLVRAWDDESPPQRADSAEGSVTIVDSAGLRRAAADAGARAEEALRRAQGLAELARDAAGRGEVQAARTYLERLRPAWERASEALRQRAQAMNADPDADAGAVDAAGRAAREVSRGGDRGLAAASADIDRGETKSAAEEASALADLAAAARASLRAAADARTLREMSRRARAARDAIRAASDPSFDRERLREALAEVRRALDELRRAARALPAPTGPRDSDGGAALAQASADADALERALAAGDAAAAADAASRLARRLDAAARALRESADASGDESVSRESAASRRVERAWESATRAQEAAVESARAAEAARRERSLARQKALIARVRERAGAAAAALERGEGPASRAAAAQTEEALERLDSDAPTAALFLRDAAVRLRAAGDAASAAELDAAGRDLQTGPPEPPPDPSATAAAARAQTESRREVEALKAELARAAREDGYMSGRAEARAGAAARDEAGAEASLRSGDSASGLEKAQAALAQLESGGSAAAAAARSSGEDLSAADGGSLGGQAAGASLRRVRLPSARDYRPARAMRDEIQRSLGESRPASSDAEVREYLERLVR